MAFLGFNKPYSDLSLNVRGIFDEYVILMVLDFLLISSNPVLDVEMRLDIGWCVIAILGATIFFAQAPIMYTNCKTLKQKLKVRSAKKKLQQRIKERINLKN